MEDMKFTDSFYSEGGIFCFWMGMKTNQLYSCLEKQLLKELINVHIVFSCPFNVNHGQNSFLNNISELGTVSLYEAFTQPVLPVEED